MLEGISQQVEIMDVVFSSLSVTSFVVYAVLGAVLVGVMYKTMEVTYPVIGVISGGVWLVAVVLGSKWVGEVYVSPLTWGEFESALLAGAFGAGVGVFVTVLVWEPELDLSSGEMDEPVDDEDREMTWYTIRHSVGTQMSREESLGATQAQMRHKDERTTMRYDQAPVEDRRDALSRMG